MIRAVDARNTADTKKFVKEELKRIDKAVQYSTEYSETNTVHNFSKSQNLVGIARIAASLYRLGYNVKINVYPSRIGMNIDWSFEDVLSPDVVAYDDANQKAGYLAELIDKELENKEDL